MNFKKQLQILFFIVLAIILINYFGTIDVYAASAGNGDFNMTTAPGFMDKLNALYDEVKVILNFMMGIGIFTNIGVLIYHFLKLSAIGGDNPQARAETIKNIMITAICSSALGSIGFIYIILTQF